MSYLVAITTAVTTAFTGLGSLMVVAVFQNGLLKFMRTAWDRIRSGRPPTHKPPKGTDPITLQVLGPGKLQASWDRGHWNFLFESPPPKPKPKPKKSPPQSGPGVPGNQPEPGV